LKILGIDVGTSSIKAVEIDSAFGRYEVQEYHERRLLPGGDPAQAISQLVMELPKAPDRVVMSLKTRQVTLRNLQLPTRDKKAIVAGVGFELDDELPFSVENAVYDFSIISQSKAGTQVHVAAATQANLTASLETWKSGGVDPEVVTTEAWAYRTLLNRILTPKDQTEPILLIQMGHERTTLYVHWRGIPILARDIPWGGGDLTTAICQRYNVSVDQAESAKLDHGFIIPPSQTAAVTMEQIEFSDVLSKPVQSLIAEVRQVRLTARNVTGLGLRQIYTSGGTSLLPGLNASIEQLLKVPVKSLPALSSIATSGVTYSETTDAVFLLACSLALCMVGSDRAATVNFRKGAFSKQTRTREFSVGSLKRPMMAAVAIILCFFTSMIVQATVYSSQIAQTNTDLERAVRGFFGNLSHSAVRTYMANITTLKMQVKNDLKKAQEMSKVTGPNPKSPITFLRDLSKSVPKDILVDMTHFQLGAEPSTSYLSTSHTTASMTFLVGSKEQVDRLSTILSTKMTNLKTSHLEQAPAPGGKGTRYKVTFTGNPTEEAFGTWN